MRSTARIREQFFVSKTISFDTLCQLLFAQTSDDSCRGVLSLSPAARLCGLVSQQSLYRGSVWPRPPSPLGQSKREARHLLRILPGNMPAEKGDKQWEEGEGGEGGRLVMNSSLQSYGNVQALGRFCRDHVAHLVFVQQQSIKLLLRARLVPLCLCAESQWQQQQQQQIGGTARRAPAGSVLQWTLRHLFCPSITSEFFICTLTHREMQAPVHRRKRLHVRTPSFWWQTDKTNATTALMIKQNAKQEDMRSV